MVDRKAFVISIIVLVIIVLVALLYGGRMIQRESEPETGTTVTHGSDSDLGVVSRRTDPETGRVLSYAIRGTVADAPREEDGVYTFTLDTGEQEEKSMRFVMGEIGQRIGYLDRTALNNEDVQGATYTSGTISEVADLLEPGQLLLVRIPVWLEVDTSEQCDEACEERIERVQENSERYSDQLEAIIDGTQPDLDIAFNISMVEIEE